MSELYHITTFENYLEILKHGLRASTDGYIYLLTSKANAAYVAKNQLCYSDNFGLLKINSEGIAKELEADNVGEITASQQRRIKQDLIKADFISLEGMYKF
jgi:RNA:NAD 2'-phosphotransferase (TPT1/KptA family)